MWIFFRFEIASTFFILAKQWHFWHGIVFTFLSNGKKIHTLSEDGNANFVLFSKPPNHSLHVLIESLVVKHYNFVAIFFSTMKILMWLFLAFHFIVLYCIVLQTLFICVDFTLIIFIFWTLTFVYLLCTEFAWVKIFWFRPLSSTACLNICLLAIGVCYCFVVCFVFQRRFHSTRTSLFFSLLPCHSCYFPTLSHTHSLFLSSFPLSLSNVRERSLSFRTHFSVATKHFHGMLKMIAEIENFHF